MDTHPGAQIGIRVRRRHALGGVAGNELLTISVGAILVVLLAAEFLTLLDLSDLLSVHMILGLVLIPPVLLKLGSTGYRMVRYYTRSPAYREEGPLSCRSGSSRRSWSSRRSPSSSRVSYRTPGTARS